jgi:acyl-CoA synthetase (AMP-forming)/AMP-acid ligase II
MDNVEVFVADEEGKLRESGVGELVIRGSNVMQGYWRSPEETDRVLRTGPLTDQRLLYSGDLFRIDENGYLYFLARLDDMIKSRGRRISPREVENVIYELPGVSAVSVIGVPDEMCGHEIKAFVCIDSNHTFTEQEIIQHCIHRLEDFMVPRRVAFVDELPRTSTGKISRRQVKELA